MSERKFRCCNCGRVFSSVKEAPDLDAKPGEFWKAVRGYYGLCPDCGNIATEILPGEDAQSPFESVRKTINRKMREDNTMKVSCKGITGELIRLERGSELVNLDLTSTFCNPKHNGYSYNLDIWDSEKKCKVSFTGIPVKDVKFLGGEVTYG